MSPEQRHQKFLALLHNSQRAVWIIAQWLNARGNTILKIPALRYAPNRAEAARYADEGDLFIENAQGKEMLIDVKGLGYQFSCAADWPFKDVLVIGRTTHDAAKRQPDAYAFLSADARHVAVLPYASRAHWRIESRFVRWQQEHKDYYVTDVDQLLFFPITIDPVTIGAHHAMPAV